MMMPIDIDGSVDDAHTILLGVEEEDYFHLGFREYIQKEQLNWWRFDEDPDVFGPPIIRWVFWSQLDNFADLIRHALQKLISKEKLLEYLVQFWAATKTSEGRTLLTTQFQPFALGPTFTTDARNWLCEYRMGMCREYNNNLGFLAVSSSINSPNPLQMWSITLSKSIHNATLLYVARLNHLGLCQCSNIPATPVLVYLRLCLWTSYLQFGMADISSAKCMTFFSCKCDDVLEKALTVGILLVTLAVWLVFEKSGYALLSLVFYCS